MDRRADREFIADQHLPADELGHRDGVQVPLQLPRSDHRVAEGAAEDHSAVRREAADESHDI